VEAVLVAPPGWTVGFRPEVAREVDGAEPVTLMVLEVEVAGWVCPGWGWRGRLCLVDWVTSCHYSPVILTCVEPVNHRLFYHCS